MASFGEELRRHRELRSVSLREIADATKINIRFLEALEANEFKHLPGGQFNKGFIRAYARHIGVEGEGMVDAYLMEIKRQDEADKALGKAAAPKHGSLLNGRAIGALAAFLLVGAAAATVTGIWLHNRSRRDGASEPPPAPAAAASDVANGPAGAPAGTSPGGSASALAALPRTPAPLLSPADGAAMSALTLLIVPSEKTRMTLSCNGAEIYTGTIEPGRTLTQKCQGVFEISMDDAGAANFSLNGERIYLGRPHQAIAGRHLSADNYIEFIQPPGGGASK